MTVCTLLSWTVVLPCVSEAVLGTETVVVGVVVVSLVTVTTTVLVCVTLEVGGSQT